MRKYHCIVLPHFFVFSALFLATCFFSYSFNILDWQSDFSLQLHSYKAEIYYFCTFKSP